MMDCHGFNSMCGFGMPPCAKRVPIMPDEKRAFVLMPFDREFDSVYTDVVKPALEEAGYVVSRADSILHQHNILTDIVGGIAGADLVLADLTTVNANVMYELGVCHALCRPAILLTQSIDDLPFDLRSYRILHYTTRFDQIGRLHRDLVDIGKRSLEGTVKFGSPVTDFLMRDDTALVPASEQCLASQGPKETVEEAGFLDFLTRTEDLNGSIGQALGGIGEKTEAFGAQLNVHTAEIERVSARPGPGMAGALYKIAVSTADDIRAYADGVNSVLPCYDGEVSELIDMLGCYGCWLEIHSDEEQLQDFRVAVETIRDSAGTALAQVREFHGAVLGLRGVSKPTNAAIRYLVDVLDQFISTTENLFAFAVRTLAILSPKQDSEQAEAGEPSAGELT